MNTLDLFALTEGTHEFDDGSTLVVNIHQPRALTSSRGDRTDYGYQHNTVVDATWSFPDGVEIHMRNTAYTSWTYNYGTFTRRESTRTSDLTKKTRVHVHADVEFDLIEDLMNRTRRPHLLWKPGVVDALSRIGLTDVKLNWSQYAGCTCPCSPGYILTGDCDRPRGINIWVTLPGVPTVDESKPGRKITV